jgi:ribonuclease Z
LKLQVPVAAFRELKYGKDFKSEEGIVYSAKELTFGEPIKSYAYITDTLFLENVARQLKGTDLIYHEATFLEELKQDAIEKYHSTASQAAQFAKIAGAKQLLIGHFSARYKDVTPLKIRL